MKKIKSFKVLVCFLILTISFLFIGCSLIKEKKPQTSLTNQEIVAEAIQKTEKLLIESSNGKDSVNPTDIFFDENVNLQKNLRCFKVTNLDNVDETMRKTGILGTSTRIYQNVTAYLGIFDYVLNHFTSDDGYGINLEYNKVYKYNDGYNARFFKLIENKNDITLLVNDNTVLTIYCNKAKTQVLSVKVIDLKDNESFVYLSEILINFESGCFGENLIYSNGSIDALSLDLKNRALNFDKICSYGFNSIQIMRITENGELKAIVVENGPENDDLTEAATIYNDLYNNIKDIYGYCEEITSTEIYDDGIVFSDASKSANSMVLVYDFETYSFYIIKIDYEDMMYILNKLKVNLQDVKYNDVSWNDEKQAVDDWLSYVQNNGKKRYTGFLSENNNCYGEFVLSSDKTYVIAEFSNGESSIRFEIKADKKCAIVVD